MCSCGGVQEIIDYRKKIERQYGPAYLWPAQSEPKRLLDEYKWTKAGCISGRAYNGAK